MKERLCGFARETDSPDKPLHQNGSLIGKRNLTDITVTCVY